MATRLSSISGPSGYLLGPLRESADFTLFRGRENGNQTRVLAVAPAAGRPSPQDLRRLEHEYSLAAELDSAWAAKPLALTRHDGRTILILDDPGGEPLDRILQRDLVGNLGQPLDLTRFLHIAVGLAKVLGQVHRRGIIHKDIKPANVLVDDSDNVWLTGFGIASQLPHERQAPAPPEIIAGTLAYMAPEQTGRMNRSIDTRSDLYSLGITLYEMLTGHLPFAAAEPLEWVHCHIARKPTPPVERVAALEPLSGIVMKLLAKNAEERYQTAFGVEADLRTCLAEWELHGHIDGFQLGAHDSPDRLMIPEKLYGREGEVNALLAAFDRVVAEGITEFVLVSGYSGVGKSSVVNELHKALVPPRGLFAAGKFDQHKRDIPYGTLAQAFQTLIRQILVKSEAEVEKWRGKLQGALGANGQLIVNFIPEMEFIVGKQPPIPDLPPKDAQNRFQLAFRRFLGAFARQEHPLTLFLDDLQWLDAATLDLLEHLATHPEVRHVLLVGAYRDNEVSSCHPIRRTLDAIRKAGTRIEEIVLTPLEIDDICVLVSDALHCELGRARPLAQLVQEKTGGNPFFAIQFLTALAEEGLLRFDPDAAAWTWVLARIRAKGYSDNVVDLMVGRLKRLSGTAQTALQQLACLGNVVEIATLSVVFGQSEEEIHTALLDAGRAGLILRVEESYAFLHDRIQEAAYALIPEGDREGVHLRIGRMLLATMSKDQLDEHLFDVANQLNRGAGRLADPNEMAEVATFNLRTGRRARASAAYASARTYFASGIALLDGQDWSSQHDLKFCLSLEFAECELLCGSLEKASQLIMELLQRAASDVEFANASCLKINLHVLTGEHPLAIDSALTCLRRFGIDLPAHPTLELVQAEYEMVWQNLNGRPIESLIDLPLMTDSEIQAAMQVLSILAGPATFTDFQLFCLLACRMVNLSLRHGVSGASAYGYACLGSVLGANFHRYHEGYGLARLACDLVEKHAFTAYDTKVNHAMGLAAFWTEPLTSVIELRRATTRTAAERGDLTFACYGMHQAITCLLMRNDPLDAVWRESEMALEFARTAKFRDVVDLIGSQQRFVASLQGRDATFSTVSDERFDEAAFEAQLTAASTPTVICLHWIRKLKARYLSGDYAEAQAAADRAKALLRISTIQLQLFDYFYYAALTVAALYENASADEQTIWRELLVAHKEQLREWAENYPPTFSDKHAIVSAEFARIEGRTLDAMQLYDQAIHSAREHGFVQNEGLADEVAARFYASRGFEAIAHMYLRNACNCYDRWGAPGKVKQLDERYPRLYDERVPASTAPTISTPVRQLDIETVFKASQALSSEIVLPKLIEKLMRIAMEHAGAERGLFIILKGSEPRIEAWATTGPSMVEVTVRQTVIAQLDLPRSMLQYVFRTRERVVLDDALVWNLYSEDEYVRQQRPRSLLCLPIVKQTKLVGALYLENNLTPRAFTAERVAVLEMLASQAAISIENATLFSDLQRSEAYLAQGQSISHTGSFGRDVDSGEIYWSEETYKIFELDRSVKPTMEILFQRIHPHDREHVRQAIDRAANEKADFDFAYRTLGQDGKVKYVQVAGRALKTFSGGLEFVGAVTDITDRKRAEEALRCSEAYLAEGQKLSQTGTWACNIATREMIHSSPEHRHLFGLAPDQVEIPSLEEFFQRIHPDDLGPTAEDLDKAISAGGNVEAHFRIVLPEGNTRYMYGIGRPLVNPSGDIDEFVGAVTDITAAKQAEEALRRSESYLAEAQRLTHTGSGAWSVPGWDALYLSEEWYRIYGFDPKQGLEAWNDRLQRMHPEDQAKVQEAKDRATIEKSDYEVDHRIVLPDGTVKYTHTVGHPVLNASGDVEQFVCTMMDVTAVKEAEDKIRESEGELRQILDFAPQHVGVLGPDRERLYVNQASLDYLGLTLEVWQSGANRMSVHPDDWKRLMSQTQNEFLGGIPHEAELRLQRKDGAYRWFLYRYSPLRDEKGRLRRWYVAGTDIEDRKQAEQRLRNENVALREEIDRASMFEEIVGTSRALRAVLSGVSKVAPTDSTVLITGETGTGKELIARAVHRRSHRSSRAFVSVNCAAIPRELIASELFGHEKGAFTGAVQRRLGRFELADGGTIFLDEIGELPAETQIALLRVLQEREFERVGGTGSIRTNVRVIAATNRDLQAVIAGGTFRSDLFYRLNVFPIEVPPLRERREDIPVLVAYFIDRYARKAGKRFRGVNKKSLELLQSYPWPGNIRELQNIIERSVIVCDTENFSVDESWLSRPPLASEPNGHPELSRKLAAQEKEMIEAALRESGGRVSGPSGAAVKLGIPGSTLDTKIRSLKIDKNRFKSTNF
jgi:PAS domain S-box-containing protein